MAPKGPLETLYAGMMVAENKVGGGEGLEGCYGSITQTGVAEVFAAFREHAGLGSGSVMVDIGSGLGRPLLHAIVEHGVARTFGVEVDAVKCQKAVPFVRHCVQHMRGEAGLELPPSSLPTFICAPVEEVPSLHPATHCYAAWEGFPQRAKEGLGRAFAASPSMHGLAIVQRSFRSRDPAEEMAELGFGRLRLVASTPVFMAGSRRQLNAYVFVKVGGGATPKAGAAGGRAKASAPATAAAPRGLESLPAFRPDAVVHILHQQQRQQQAQEACASEGAAGPSSAGTGAGAKRPTQGAQPGGRAAKGARRQGRACSPGAAAANSSDASDTSVLCLELGSDGSPGQHQARYGLRRVRAAPQRLRECVL